MVDKLKPGTKAWYDRQDRHRHNSFIGCAAMMRAQCNSITASKTVTYEAKRLANQIQLLSIDLALALKTRIDS